jgi:excisionase family DNA binding protein
MTSKKVFHLSTTDAANRLGVSPRTVLAWVRAGHVIGTKLPNNRYVVLASEIDRLTRPLDLDGTTNELDVRGDR